MPLQCCNNVLVGRGALTPPQVRSDNTDGCGVNVSISALACAIAKGKTTEEITALGAFFTQLGDSLETIAAFNAIDCKNE